jgi:hypothetical protein
MPEGKPPLIVLMTRVRAGETNEWTQLHEFPDDAFMVRFSRTDGKATLTVQQTGGAKLAKLVEDDDVWFIRGPWFTKQEDRTALAAVDWRRCRRELVVRVHVGGGNPIGEQLRSDCRDVAGLISDAGIYSLGDRPSGDHPIVALAHTDPKMGPTAYDAAYTRLREHLGVAAELRLTPSLLIRHAKHGILNRFTSFDLDLQRWAELNFSDDFAVELLSSGKYVVAMRLLQAQVLGKGEDRLPMPGMKKTVKEAADEFQAQDEVGQAMERLEKLCKLPSVEACCTPETCKPEERGSFLCADRIVQLHDNCDANGLRCEVSLLAEGNRDPFRTWLCSLGEAFDKLRQAVEQADTENR